MKKTPHAKEAHEDLLDLRLSLAPVNHEGKAKNPKGETQNPSQISAAIHRTEQSAPEIDLDLRLGYSLDGERKPNTGNLEPWRHNFDSCRKTENGDVYLELNFDFPFKFSSLPCEHARGGSSNNVQSSEEEKGRTHRAPLVPDKPVKKTGLFDLLGTSDSFDEASSSDKQHRWVIKRVLKYCDLDGQCRLILKKRLAIQHIISLMDDDRLKKVASDQGMTTDVLDYDTNTYHELIFKYWKSSYVLMGTWKASFVLRRGLKIGDLIGLYWNCTHNIFLFSVLCRGLHSE